MPIGSTMIPVPLGVLRSAPAVGALLRTAVLARHGMAWVLNRQPHDVPVLVAAGLLKPLGNPLPNSVKYFAAMEVLELAKDRA